MTHKKPPEELKPTRPGDKVLRVRRSRRIRIPRCIRRIFSRLR